MSDYIAVRPYGNAGYLTHVIEDKPKTRAQMGMGNMVLRGRSLCGRATRTDFLIVGGPKNPTPVGEALDKTLPWSYVCETCHRRWLALQDGAA